MSKHPRTFPEERPMEGGMFGGGEYLNCGADTSLDITTFSIEISLMRKESNSSGYIISKNNLDSTDNQYGVYIDASGRVIYYPSSALQTNVSAVTTNRYTDIVLTRSAGAVGYIYLDGVQAVGPTAVIDAPNKPTFPVRLGCRWAGGADPHLLYSGVIRHCRLYSTVLTPTNVADLYHNRIDPLQAFGDNLRLWLDLTQPPQMVGGVQKIPDKSNFGNHATVYGNYETQLSHSGRVVA